MDSRIKILFISNIPAPYRIDFYNELGKYMDVTVIFEAKRAPGINFNWKEKEINRFFPVFLSEGEIKEKKVDWSIFHYLRNPYRYDYIVITNYAYLTEMAALFSLKLKKIPYYYELDGAMVDDGENMIKRWLKKFFLRGAKGYFSPSCVSDDYVKFYAGEKAKIIRYPFTSIAKTDIISETDQSKELLKIQLGVSEKKMVLAVGQFIHRKGFDVLIKSIGGNEDVGYYIVGGSPTMEMLKLKNDLKLKNLHFEGFKTKEELSKYFRAADVFVLPTREDIWGLVVNEAMCYGLPVVTTNKCVAGLELLPKECIVEVEDVRQLHEKIQYLLDNDEYRRKMSRSNLAKIENYTIENMAQVHVDYFEIEAKR